MNKTAETVPASDHRAKAHDGWLVDRAWRPKRKASVRPLVVVVPHVLVENSRKVTSTQDQHPVQALLPVRPEHASRAFRAFAHDAGIAAHPHLLRHSLASAMAAAREPASVIAGQLRHADGGTLASRTYIHQLPQTPPHLARLIEDLYDPAARQARSRDRN
jgi:integrase